MSAGGWDYLLWLTGFTLNLGLLCVLLHKRRFQKFPWFTLLIAQDAVQTIVLLCVHNYRAVNFYTYWSFETLDALLRLLVLYEVSIWARLPGSNDPTMVGLRTIHVD